MTNRDKSLKQDDLRPTVRLLLLLAIFKLVVITGLAIIVLRQGQQLDQQQRQINTSAQGVDRIDNYVQQIQDPTATQAQQIILYKIFYAICEGRFTSNSPSARLDPSIDACAARLYLLSPTLPTSENPAPITTQPN